PGNSEEIRLAAGAMDLCQQHGPITVADLAGPRDLMRVYQFVSCRQNSNVGRRVYGRRCCAGGDKGAEMLRTQDRASSYGSFPAPHLLAARQNVLAGTGRLVFNLDVLVIQQSGALDHDHGISTGWDGRPGHDSYRLSLSHRFVRRLTGR